MNRVSKSAWVKITLAVVALLLAVGFQFFPWLLDDLVYRTPFRSYHLEGGPIDFGAIWEHWLFRHNTDNSRLATLVMIFAGFVPKWITSVISAAMAYVVMYMMLRFTGHTASMVYASIVAFCFILFVPWIDCGYVLATHMSYMWGSAFALVLSYVLLFRQGGGSAWLYVVAAVVGLWQEAIGLPVLVGLTACIIMYPSMRNKRNFIAAALIFSGLVWLYLSPGGREYRKLAPLMSRALSFALILCLPTFVMVAMMLYRYLRHRLNLTPELLFLAVSAMASVVVGLYFKSLRLFTWSEIASTTALLIIISQQPYKGFWRYARPVATCCLAFTIIHLISVDVRTYNMQQNYKELLRQYLAKPYEVAYIPFPMRTAESALYLFKPYDNPYNSEMCLNLISRFYLGEDAPPMQIAHAHMREFTPDKGQAIDGGELMMYKNFIVGPAGEIPTREEWLFVDYGDGGQWRTFMRQNFTGADGKSYSFFRPSFLSSPRILLYPTPIIAHE